MPIRRIRSESGLVYSAQNSRREKVRGAAGVATVQFFSSLIEQGSFPPDVHAGCESTRRTRASRTVVRRRAGGVSWRGGEDLTKVGKSWPSSLVSAPQESFAPNRGAERTPIREKQAMDRNRRPCFLKFTLNPVYRSELERQGALRTLSTKVISYSSQASERRGRSQIPHRSG